MAARPRVAVIEAGQRDAAGLSSLFIPLGHGGLSVSSYLHQNGYKVTYFPMFTSTRLDWRYPPSANYLLISTMAHAARLRDR
jgi:hypothetical protein